MTEFFADVVPKRAICLWVAAIRWMAVRRRADGGYLWITELKIDR